MKTITITGAVALAALLAIASTANAETATGCLKKNGQLVQVRLGDKPVKKCVRGTKQVVMSLHAPGRALRFHEVIRFGETLNMSDRTSGWGQFLIEVFCNGSPKGASATMIVHHHNPSIAIMNGEATGVSSLAEGYITTSYDRPHMYDFSATNGTIDVISGDGDRIHVEATLVVNHVECIISGTAELFTR